MRSERAAGLRFGLLGPTVVYDADGTARPVGGAKGRVLLTALLLEPGRVVAVEVLKDALWGETPPASAHASLQNHVTRLRRLLDDPERLRSVPPGYRLRVADGELDVRVFEARVAAARAAHARRDWARAAAEALAALGLWRGTPLSDLPPEVGGLSLVQRLEEARLFALECRYDAELERELELGLEAGRGVADGGDEAGGGGGGVGLAGLAPELAALVAEFPLREAFHRQLMLVLYRTGRQAEALAVHRDLRRTLVRELGVEPGLAVREAHQEILREPERRAGVEGVKGVKGEARTSPAGVPGTSAAPEGREAPAVPGVPENSVGLEASEAPVVPEAHVPVPVPRPAQLPPAPVYFTGRTDTIRDLRAALVPAGDGRPRAAVVSGMAGVGKSALGLQVAHVLREEFPDGQLYVRLHGATPGVPPLTSGQALAALLRDLGVEPRGVPEHPDAASALLRSLLAPTRTLLVLDDAANAAQVRPLLPAGPGCAVIVTSRSPLTALDGVSRFPLGPLSGEESAALLRAVSGRDGLDGTHPLVGLTGRLPLALRIVAARLAARRVLTPDALAGQLAASDERLHHLEYDDLSVRRSLAVALDALRASDRETDRDAAFALRRIGALDLPTYGVPLLARLLGTGERRAEAALDRLVDVALLDETTYGRYTPHDLVRDFAREVARAAGEGGGAGRGEEGEADAEGLGRRSMGLGAGPVDLSAGSTDPASTPAAPGSSPAAPGFQPAAAPGSDQAHVGQDPTDITLRWYIAAARQCVLALTPSGVDRDNRLGATPAERERTAVGGEEAEPFASAAEAVAWGDREVANVVALVEGRAAGSPLVPVLVRSLFPYLQRRGRLPELETLGRRALDVARRLGDDAAEAIALSDLAGLHFMQGQAGEALALTDQALARWRVLGVASRIQRCLNNRGLLLESLGRYAECEVALRESLELARELGDMAGEAIAYSNLGNLYEHTDPRAAIAWHERSIALGELMGDSRVRESGHCNIGYAHLTLGEPAGALEHFDRAVSVSDGVDWQSGSQTRLGLVQALRGLDRTERAARECAELLERAEQRADRYTTGLARHQRGLLHRSAGRSREAYEEWALALDALDGTDSPVTGELRRLLGDID